MHSFVKILCARNMRIITPSAYYGSCRFRIKNLIPTFHILAKIQQQEEQEQPQKGLHH